MKTLFLVIQVALSSVVIGQTTLDAFITNHMETKHVSGLAGVIIEDGDIIWEGYYGLANRNTMMPVNENSIFMLASISKTVTATALMQLYEQGYFELDDAVSDYLPFTVSNPNTPPADITFRHLLTHTASIKDNWSVMSLLYTFGDSPISLYDFMENYFSEGGAYYSASSNFYNAYPGVSYHYSNIGASLCGLLTEVISGMPFNTYCNTQIFEPLCMENTAWFLSELDTTLIARPYSYFLGNYSDEGLYGYPDYPDGQLRTTARSLAKFLSAYMLDGAFLDETILEASTIDSMLYIQYPDVQDDQGLIWYSWENNGHLLWGHNGGDAGVSTDMYFDPLTNRGYVILTNSDDYNDPVLDAMLDISEDELYETPLTLDCDMPAGLSQMEMNSSLLVWPNPASDVVYFSAITDSNMPVIMLTNAVGISYQVQAKQLENAFEVDCSSLPAGMYYYHFMLDGKVKSGHFMHL